MERRSSPGARPLASISVLVFLVALGAEAAAEPPRYQNPIVRQRADPWVYRHTDGWYYFTASVPEYDRIEIRRARTIQGLGSAPAVVVWRRHDNGIMSANIWAPEIHSISGSWYIYFAAAERDAPFNHRVYVLENESADPLAGQWMEKGQIQTGWQSFSLDATEFDHGSVHYLVWAQKDFGIRGNSNLYIAAMSNPWTISGKAVRISKPEFPWERRGYWVNEGMGMLTASDAADLLDPASWVKSSLPVLQTDAAAGIYGPGHSSFTVDGEYDILVYHARAYRDIAGIPSMTRTVTPERRRWRGIRTGHPSSSRLGRTKARQDEMKGAIEHVARAHCPGQGLRHSDHR